MYYLRKEPEVHILNGIKHHTDDRALFKSDCSNRFYRMHFANLDCHPCGMHIYTCKTIKSILKVRERLHEYCGEWFDVYDEFGKLTPEELERRQMKAYVVGVGDNFNDTIVFALSPSKAKAKVFNFYNEEGYSFIELRAKREPRADKRYLPGKDTLDFNDVNDRKFMYDELGYRCEYCEESFCSLCYCRDYCEDYLQFCEDISE